jgi:hypothetical protein
VLLDQQNQAGRLKNAATSQITSRSSYRGMEWLAWQEWLGMPGHLARRAWLGGARTQFVERPIHKDKKGYVFRSPFVCRAWATPVRI